jgi:hypothetical protein
MKVSSKIAKETMTNRYGDSFVFTLLEDGNIQWEGKFEYIRVGFPNDYTDAYRAYTTNDGVMGLKEFKEEVHRHIYDENDRWVGPCDIARVYGPMVKSKDEINMVDPSGGPYLTEGMEIMGKTIKEFKSNEKGYLIITK